MLKYEILEGFGAKLITGEEGNLLYSQIKASLKSGVELDFIGIEIISPAFVGGLMWGILFDFGAKYIKHITFINLSPKQLSQLHSIINKLDKEINNC